MTLQLTIGLPTAIAQSLKKMKFSYKRTSLSCILAVGLVVVGLAFSYIRVKGRLAPGTTWSTTINRLLDSTTQQKYRYRNGYEFQVSPQLLADIGFPMDIDTMTSQTAEDKFDKDNFVFVTAASSNHRHDSFDAVGNVQRYFNNTIYYYDLDENPSRYALTKLSQLCNVIYRKFNFSRYPHHVRALNNFAFKPLIVHELLHEHTTIFWIDSSIRFSTSNLTAVFQRSVKTDGVVLFVDTQHSIFATTHPTTFSYLPISRTAATNVTMRGAGAFYMHCSRKLYQAVIQWWTLCALEFNCTAPTTNRACHFTEQDRYTVYANCHRYDQSSLNILLANHYNYDFNRYTGPHVLKVEPGPSGKEWLHVCNPPHPRKNTIRH